MEDAHIHLDNVHETIGDLGHFKQLSFYGVYDGHGGTTSAELVEKLLHANIFACDSFRNGNVPDAISRGFLSTDKTIVDQANEQGWMNGSTAVVGIVADKKLYMGNIGDSEAILISIEDGQVKTHNLTTPHKASDPIEKERIEKLGGHVFFGRVFGALAVSRAFGDSRYKQPKTSQDFVTADPALHDIELAPSHKYLLLACDGLWDVMNHQTAAEIVHRFCEEGKDPTEVATLLVQEALRKRTEDNVTVIVVYITWNSEGSSSDSDDDDDEDEGGEGEEHKADPASQSAAPAEATTAHSDSSSAAAPQGNPSGTVTTHVDTPATVAVAAGLADTSAAASSTTSAAAAASSPVAAAPVEHAPAAAADAAPAHQ
jgi:protein phosphatase 2C family protein 2/3